MRKLLSQRAVRAAALFGALVLLAVLLVRPVQYYFFVASDVLLYQRYAEAALRTPPELPAEYPPLSVALFVVPQLSLPQFYLEAFAVMAALATGGVALLVDKLSGKGWNIVLLVVVSAWGTFYSRYDIFVVLCTMLAFAACLRQRWLLAQALLSLGVALKFYPLVLMPLVVAWQWRQTGRLPLRAVVVGGIGVLLAVGSMWLVDPQQFMAVLQYHSARPIEIEALGASLIWLLGPVAIDSSYGSINLVSPSSSIVIALLTGLNFLLLGGIYVALWAGKLRPAAAWALVLLISVGTSKVFSTQYMLWVLPFVILALAEAEQAASQPRAVYALSVLWMTICVLTGTIFPLGFRLTVATIKQLGTVALDKFMLLITLRNGLWVMFIVLAAWLWAKASSAPTRDGIAS